MLEKDKSSSTKEFKENLDCFNIICQLPNGENVLKHYKELGELKNVSLKNYLFDSSDIFNDDILPLLKIKLTIIQMNAQNKAILIYDNRFLKIVKPFWIEHCIILDKHEVIIQKGDFSICPKVFDKKSFLKNLPEEKTLYELISKEKNIDFFKNPSNYTETKKILKKLNLEFGISIIYYYKTFQRHPRFIGRLGECWFQPKPGDKSLIKIDAFLKPNFTIGFRDDTNYLCKLNLKPVDDIEKVEELPKPLNEYQKNYSTSVNVKLLGLNAFYNLTMITMEDWKKVCVALGETVGVLIIELDEKNNARFATYKDFHSKFQIELFDQTQWTNLFDFMFKQRELIMEKKKKILEPIMTHLSHFVSDIRDAFKLCHLNLEAFILHSQILVYSLNDFVCHSLKSQFAYYMMKKIVKRNNGIPLIYNAKNDLVKLQHREMSIYNFHNYLELPETIATDFDPVFKSNLKYLRHHLPQINNASTWDLVKDRGNRLSEELYKSWNTFGKMFLDEFDYDIFSLPFTSLPSLSYNAVWTKYTRKGGPYHHGLEKIKAFDKELLRKHCVGGFSFSAKCERKVNDPLDKNSSETCQNIQAYDICSSYGFACSELGILGFGKSYKFEDNNVLRTCDTFNRFNSFEFLAVFYTLHQLETKGIKIKTVYSNYSQFGTFNIKKFPLDLVVISDLGNIFCYNYDSIFSHGCRNNCVNRSNFFIQNQKRKDLEDKAQLRDNVINAWCEKINASMKKDNFCEYHVLSDCHHLNYKKKHLKNYLNQHPILTPLVSDYFEKEVIHYDDILFGSENLTFIGIIEGHAPNPSHTPLLLLRNKEWTRANSTHTGVLMTRDYLKWLMTDFNFKVTKIHKIWIYKKCNIFKTIFQSLVEKRASLTISQEQKQNFKQIINLCTGVFGFNQEKRQTYLKVTLVNSIPQNYNPVYHFAESSEFIENTQFIVLKKVMQRKKSDNRNFPLALYCLVTEFGKKRLSECFSFFDAVLYSNKFKLLYSQIDNLILLLSTNSLEEALNPNCISKYNLLKNNLFGNNPGQLKKEFEFTSKDNFRFVTAMCQNYSILADDSEKNVQKNSGLNRISSQTSYDASIKMLNKQMVVFEQERRKNKMCNTEMVIKTICFQNN